MQYLELQPTIIYVINKSANYFIINWFVYKCQEIVKHARYYLKTKSCTILGVLRENVKITYGSNGPLISGAEETNQQLF